MTIEKLRLKCLKESIKLVTKGQILVAGSSLNGKVNDVISVSDKMYDWVTQYSNSNFKKNRQ